ncbi:MAG: hypothetical protein IKU62_00130 [Ruminiclostridium sp.]|nr:hypothetical protein [Ruminiclostridium sp.]
MMLLFNRKELAVVFSLEQKDTIAANLSQAGIDYQVKARDNLAGPSLSLEGRRAADLFMDQRNRWKYTFYVKTSDLDYARHCMYGTPGR